MFIPEIKLAIEYDGSFWHKDKREYDKKKTQILINEGIRVIRIRQKPLKKIFNSDILVDKKFNGKKFVNDIITQIQNDFDLTIKQLKMINKYLACDNLMNEKSMEVYIDKILKERAAKKELHKNEPN